MKYTYETPIKDVVADDFRSAALFQKYGLDFCCGGARPIGEACSAKGFDPSELLQELDALGHTAGSGMPKFNRWDLDLLADYIIENHHRYLRDMIPVIGQHAEKVARVHGTYRPELVEVAEVFGRISRDLSAHMEKEEKILFPYVKSLARAKRDSLVVGLSKFGSCLNPIQQMELEHDAAGDDMAEIRRLTSDYTPPIDACGTYRVLFQELAEFEQDLHVHVHLENNILFPKAIALETELQRRDSGVSSSSVASSCALP
jgi:regulator of cell morphogenesis and NO signaling